MPPENEVSAKKASLCDNKSRKQTVMSATLTALALEGKFIQRISRRFVGRRRDVIHPTLALEPFCVYPKLLRNLQLLAAQNATQKVSQL